MGTEEGSTEEEGAEAAGADCTKQEEKEQEELVAAPPARPFPLDAHVAAARSAVDAMPVMVGKSDVLKAGHVKQIEAILPTSTQG